MNAPELPNPARARRGARRTVVAGIAALILLTGFTAGGIAMLAAGELPGLPFAVGGLAAQLAVLVLVVTVLRARSGDTNSRPQLESAGAAFNFLRRALLVVLVALVAYAVVRAVLGDYWTLITTAVIGVVLLLLHRGARRLQRGINR
ncbi:hypothetical protein DFJ67_5104 [Asanoa ferruginea]|uniref:Uncharacterized protein n=1 Tax=Asanoa ferruginea TaxID=53367 RepID=A0A3D9ZNX6_9ACTN|nr:hypothetical protein [Asanoa ferruginea]REF99078.1 hypothetical protein DFJ67_5104 [Asanoa ferruginea]GIF51358.1 hypothetical protein Afe04nite_58970 [Asanoa ferruginea]